MVHCTLFGYTEAEIAPVEFTAFTMCGFSSLRRPTLAQRIMHRYRRETHPPRKMDRWLGRNRSMVITFFGAVEISAPTLMEEYSGLRNLVASGAIERTECRRILDGLARGDDPDAEFSRVTLFGACIQQPPNVKQEDKALRAGEAAGLLPTEIRRELAQAIGCPEATAVGILGKLALA